MQEAIDQILQTQMPWKTLMLTEQEYKDFRKHYVLSLLKGESLGRAFCDYFGVNDYTLLADSNDRRVDKVIRQSYLKRQQVVQELYRKDK